MMSITLRKKIKKAFMVGFVLLTSCFMLFPKTQSKAYPITQNVFSIQQQQEALTHRHSVDQSKIKINQNLTTTQNLISQLLLENEILLGTIQGTKMVGVNTETTEIGSLEQHLDTTMKMGYEAVLTIPLSKIKLQCDKCGILSVQYDPNDIIVKSVEIKNFNVSDNQGLLSRNCTAEELLALIELGQEQLRNDLVMDTETQIKAMTQFETYMTTRAKDSGIYGICFNNKAVEQFKSHYSFKSMTNVNYGYNAKHKIDRVEYIVIHSTDNPNVSALQHIHWLNTNKKGAKAVHYYADSKNVIQALDTQIQAWGVGDGGSRTPIQNNNSIQIEISEYTDKDQQELAINNTIMFIQKVLLPKYPNAKIVMHKDASGKHCPRVLLDKENGWKLFLDRIYNTQEEQTPIQ